MSVWQDISTAPLDGSTVIVGKMTNSQVCPAWPLKSRYIDGRWTMHMGADQWSSFDPQPTHWKPALANTKAPEAVAQP